MKGFPNILLILSDQHRSFDLGCYGNDEVISPNFDRFAKSAMVFTNCVSNSPLCVPARGCLMTGLMPDNHRAITNDLPIDNALESIATVMNRYGYHTGYIGKWHLGGVPRDRAIPKDERLGFTEWKAYNCAHQYFDGFYFNEDNVRHSITGYEPIGQTDLAIDFIERGNGRKPWGLVLSYGPPHDPYTQVPEQYLNLYRDKNLSLRPNVRDEILAEKGVIRTKDQIVSDLKGYYAHITALDEQFGRILHTLEQTKQLENTVVVYTSDHGDMLGSQAFTNKQLPFEEAISVPLMVYQKDVTIPAVCDELICLADLSVSVLALAGLRFEHKTDGENRSSLFTDRTAKGADFAYLCDLVPCHQAYFRGSPEWRGIKTRRYTYARSFDGEFCVLFDNQNDPYQLNNLAHDAQLRARLEDQLTAAVTNYDEFLRWDQFIVKRGYQKEWNRSQKYFRLPLLEHT